MEKNNPPALPRRRFGQGLLAALAALPALKLNRLKRRRAPTALHEADFYETERP